MDPLWNNIFRKKLDEESLAYFLKHLPIFSELTPRSLAVVEDLVHVRNYKAHETIFEEGDPGSGMYMIRNGSVEIYAKNESGVEDELARLTPGDFFGETTLTAPAPRSAFARTLEVTELVGLFRADILELAERKPSISSNILLGLTRVLSERLQAASQEIRRLRNQVGEHVSPEKYRVMNSPLQKHRGWSRAQVALAFLVLTAAIACGLSIYSSASSLIGLSRAGFSVLFLPLLFSLVLSFLLDPLVTQLEKFFSRTGSIFIVYVLTLGLASLSILWMTPHWQDFWNNMGTDFPRYTTQMTVALKGIVAAMHDRFPMIAEYDFPLKVRVWAEQLMATVLAHTPQSAMKIGSLMIIVPLFTFFFLRDGRNILRTCVSLAPNRHFEMVRDLSYLISRQLSQFVRGRILEALIIGLVVTAGLSLTDIRYASVLGIFAGVTNLIPYIGPIIGMVPGILIAFVDLGVGGQFWWIVILYILIAQVLIDNFILIPVLISRVSNLHPLLVFFAIIVGGKLYGIIGMIIGVPILSVIKITLLEVRTYRRAFRLPETALESERPH